MFMPGIFNDSLFDDFKHLPKLAKEVDDELFAEFKKLREEVSKKVDGTKQK